MVQGRGRARAPTNICNRRTSVEYEIFFLWCSKIHIMTRSRYVHCIRSSELHFKKARLLKRVRPHGSSRRSFVWHEWCTRNAEKTNARVGSARHFPGLFREKHRYKHKIIVCKNRYAHCVKCTFQTCSDSIYNNGHSFGPRRSDRWYAIK